MSNKIIYLKYAKTKKELNKMLIIDLENEENLFDVADFVNSFEETMNSLLANYKIDKNKRNFIKMLHLKEKNKKENYVTEIKNEEEYSNNILKNSNMIFYMILYNAEKEIKEEERKKKEEEERKKKEEEERIKNKNNNTNSNNNSNINNNNNQNDNIRHSNTNIEINNLQRGNLEKKIEDIYKLNVKIYKQELENKQMLENILNILNNNNNINNNNGINLSVNNSVENLKNSNNNINNNNNNNNNSNLPNYDLEYEDSEKIIYLRDLIEKKCIIELTLKNKSVLIPKNCCISYYKEKYNNKENGITFNDFILNEIQANESFEIKLKLKLNKDIYKIKNELDLFYIFKDNNKNIINKNSFGKIKLKINNYPFIYEDAEKYIKNIIPKISEDIQNALIKFEGNQEEALNYLLNN